MRHFLKKWDWNWMSGTGIDNLTPAAFCTQKESDRQLVAINKIVPLRQNEIKNWTILTEAKL
jgi:hypothetical protein